MRDWNVFDKFPKNNMKVLLGDFNAKVGREDIFKPTIWDESLHKISNVYVVRVVNVAISKNLTVRSTMLHITEFINILGCLQTGKPTIRLTIF
jgi:hypothetical protein